MIAATASSSHPTDSIRVYLSAPSTTGGDGVSVQLAFDATSSLITADDASLAAGKVVVGHDFEACVMAKVRFTGTAGLTDVHAYLYLEPVGGGGDVLLDDAHCAAGSSGVYELRLEDMPSLALGDKLRVDVQSDGAGSVTINAGDAVTYLKVRAI